MRTVEIRCDRCGDVIPDKPIRISMEKLPRTGPHIGGEFLRELKELEFCQNCAEDISRFAINPPDGTERGDSDETPQDT